MGSRMKETQVPITLRYELEYIENSNIYIYNKKECGNGGSQQQQQQKQWTQARTFSQHWEVAGEEEDRFELGTGCMYTKGH